MPDNTQNEPVAWMRRWAFEGNEGTKGDRPRGWKLREVTTTKLLADDVPLYTRPASSAAVDALREALDRLISILPAGIKPYSDAVLAVYGSLPEGQFYADLATIKGSREAVALANTPKQTKPWCETCGKDVHEVLCPTCAKWWNDNPPPNGEQSAGLVEELRRYPDWLSTLNNIVRALEDEGDRVYLGSTNDADDLREVVKMLDALSHAKALATPDQAVMAERERCAQLAENATLPEGYIWGRDAMEQFDFGKERAAAAIRAQGEPK